MARLPSSIYKALVKKQEVLGTGFLTIGEAQEEFIEAGYKICTANKWLLNWGVAGAAKFIRGVSGNHVIVLGDFSDMDTKERMDNYTVWLPVKEVIYSKKGKSNGVIL